MNRYIRILTVLIATLAGCAFLCAQSVELKLLTASNDESVTIGDNFAISIVLNNMDGVPEMPKQVAGCEVISLTQSGSSTSWINGVKSSSLSYQLLLKAIRKGKYKFGPIEINGIKSNEVEYEILRNSKSEEQQQTKKNEQSDKSDLGLGNDLLFLKVEVSHDDIYQNVPFEYVVKLYTQLERIVSFDIVKMPQFKNCTVEDTYNVSSRYEIEEVNGERYGTCIVECFKVTPQKSGRIKCRNGKYEVVANIPIYTYDPFWGQTVAYQKQHYILDIPDVDIDVKHLDADVPDEFSGVVGQFTISPKLSNDNPTKGEVVTLSYIVAGESRGIENVFAKQVADISSDKLEVIKNKKESDLSMPEGFKKYEYYLRPLEDGVYAVPKIPIVYLNPETLEFEKTVVRGFNIVVGGMKN